MDGLLVLDNFYNLKSLTIKKVEFKGANSVLALGNEVIDKKEFTKTVTFTEVPRLVCPHKLICLGAESTGSKFLPKIFF